MSGQALRAPERLTDAEIAELCDVLIDCVEGGASVSFMLPLSRARAEAFWRRTGQALERGELRIILAETPGGRIVGTVQILLDQPENQLHRAALAKMLVHRSARCQGIGAALLGAAETLALGLGKTLLVLDTSSAEAARLYARQGWQYSGEIPRYALWPAGGACATWIYYKLLAD